MKVGPRRNLLRQMFNRVLHLLARALPGATSIRPFLHRLRGVHIHGTVFIGDDVYIENEYPDCVEIDNGALIGLRSTIVAHTRGSGKIIIGKNAVIAAGCLVVGSAGQHLTIGEGAVISAGSVVTNSVPAFTLCGPPRIKMYARVTTPFTLDTSQEDFRRGLRTLDPQNREP